MASRLRVNQPGTVWNSCEGYFFVVPFIGKEAINIFYFVLFPHKTPMACIRVSFSRDL